MFSRTGLSVSIGAARTKVVASIASRLERPRGFRMVAPGEEEAFLTPLPAEKLHGIGHVHAGALAERGIATIGQLRQVPKAALQAAFGEAIGQQIWERARGLDGREVLLPSTPKSVSRETTIEAARQKNELFDPRANRRWYLNREMDRVRGRYGWNAVFYGKGLELREHYATKPNGLVLSTPCLSR